MLEGKQKKFFTNLSVGETDAAWITRFCRSDNPVHVAFRKR